MDQAVELREGLMLFTRAGIYQMRLRVAPNKYVWRSLKTRNKREATDSALREFFTAEAKAKDGGSYVVPSLQAVIDQYKAAREIDHKRGLISAGMIYQIGRVQKFWIEYAGKKPIDEIDDRILRGYVDWRLGYYTRKGSLPKNAKLHPTEQTMEWEITYAKSLLNWAHGKGYRGNKALPKFKYLAKDKRVRPAFEINEYRKLYQMLRKRTYENTQPAWAYTRLMLRDYVLILANSGLRVGELNNLKLRDVHPFKDQLGRENYRFTIKKSKTGERDAILRASAKRWVDRAIERRRLQGASDNDLLFVMFGGTKITTLTDQFGVVLEQAGITHSSVGEPYTLYSLRHFYAVQALRRGTGVFELARNMGTSVEIIQSYYGKSATASKFATGLGN